MNQMAWVPIKESHTPWWSSRSMLHPRPRKDQRDPPSEGRDAPALPESLVRAHSAAQHRYLMTWFAATSSGSHTGEKGGA
jgi:hypothetical protein